MSLTVSPRRSNRFVLWARALSGLGLLTILGCAQGAIAQPIPVPPAMQSPETAQQFLFVNPSSGSDEGQGITQRSPFRTLTRALQSVQPNNASNTIIMLTAGTYASDTGEVFPLIMPPGVMIQGDPSTKGQNIVIKGGGLFTTATAGRQNVAIVGAGQIVGVTVSNPNPNGYGVWIEAGSPNIANNTFTGSNLAGVAIMGNSTPTLWGNAFSHNRTGIMVAATAQPAIKDSLDQVEAATLGVSTEQHNPPSSVAIAPATPTPNLTTPTPNPIRPQSSATLIQTLPVRSAALQTHRSRRSASASQPRITPPATVAPISLNPPLRPTSSARSAAHQRSRTERPSSVNIPVPAPQVAERRRDLPVSRSTPIPVPLPETRTASSSSFTEPPASGVQSNLLRVPAEPPIGNVGDLPVVNISRNPLQHRESSSKQSAAARGLRYRVVVAAGSRVEQVRSLFPGAFTTYSGGEAVLQVGAFGDRANAEEAAQILDSNGLNGTIEPLDN